MLALAMAVAGTPDRIRRIAQPGSQRVPATVPTRDARQRSWRSTVKPAKPSTLLPQPQLHSGHRADTADAILQPSVSGAFHIGKGPTLGRDGAFVEAGKQAAVPDAGVVSTGRIPIGLDAEFGVQHRARQCADIATDSIVVSSPRINRRHQDLRWA
jgi:hypothetical protein